MSKARKKALVGYKRRDTGTHRRYNWKASIKRFHKTGKFVNKGTGSGHKAGEEWARKKNIDPNSKVTRYGKNSPSFDEGVYKHKQDTKMKALLAKMK